jgi:hypothetical protein
MVNDGSNIINKLIEAEMPPQYRIKDGYQIMISYSWDKFFKDIKDSLGEDFFDTQVNTATQAFCTAKTKGLGTKECNMVFICALFSNIGKAGIQKTIGMYPGFNLIGGALLEDFWSKDLETLEISENDWGEISSIIDLNLTKLQTENQYINYNLVTESMKRIISCFIDTPIVPRDFSCSGIIIFLNGKSCSGKTTFANLLKEMMNKLKLDHVIINRDHFMISTIYQHLGEKFSSPLTPKEYQKAYNCYSSNRKHFAPIINNQIKNCIKKSLDTNKIVILDTVMTMFPDAIPEIFPDVLPDTVYKISFWLHRNQIITKKDAECRFGINLNKQVQLYEGSPTILNPFPNAIPWQYLVETDLSDFVAYPYQANLSLSIGWKKLKMNVIETIFTKFV